MYLPQANRPDCWKCTLHVEWHDCSWCPSIVLRRGIENRRGAPARPLPAPAVMASPARRKNLAKPMKKITVQKSKLGRSSAFTLVELLTVIAIIGILAAMLLPVIVTVKKHALMTRAGTEAQGIVTAIEGYDSDYGRFPLTKPEQQAAVTNDFTTGYVQYPQNNSVQWPGATGGGYTYDNNSNVVAILMDLQTYPDGAKTENYGHVYNPKQVKYLNAKPSGYDPSTAQLNPPGGVDNSGVYRDPWGNPYIITMNTSYNVQGCSDIFYSLQTVSQSSGQTGFNGLFNPNFASNPDDFLYHGKVMVWSAGPDGKVDPNVSANQGVNKDNILSWK